MFLAQNVSFQKLQIVEKFGSFVLHVFILFTAVISEKPECRIDADCPTQLTCIREICQNPCLVQNPCVGSQTCVVKDIGTSLRSVACECPEGLLYGDNGECIKCKN